jgi:protease-4
MADPTPTPSPSYGSTPPPQPYPPYYAPPPPPPRPGILAGFTKLGGVISIASLVFIAGFYVAIFSLTRGDHLTASHYQKGKGPDRIAIIPVNGTISGATHEFIREAVEAVLDDKSIKAVVLRVQSPGGGATASDQILHEINRLRSERHLPIVASYGDYAASGGYYVSCQADIIFAEPTTTTGSIGVLAEVPTLQTLLEQKLGVKFEVLSAKGSPEKTTANDLFRDWNEKDRATMQKLLDSMYTQFAGVVAEGRKGKISTEQLPNIANGAIYTAAEAKANGLVDEIGYLDAAIATAAKLGKIAEANPPVVIFERPRGFLSMVGLSGSLQPGGGAGLAGMLDPNAARAWIDDFAVPRTMYMLHR